MFLITLKVNSYLVITTSELKNFIEIVDLKKEKLMGIELIIMNY
jgi:hypothetical protein